MHSRFIISLAVLALGLPLPSPGHAETTLRDAALDVPVKIYSNICISEHSGDLLGHQMVVYNWGGMLLFQETSGWFGDTQGADFTITGDQITFSVNVKYDGRPRTVTFSGTVTKEAIIGTFDDDSPYLSGTMTFEARPNVNPSLPTCTDEIFPYPGLAAERRKSEADRLNQGN